MSISSSDIINQLLAFGIGTEDEINQAITQVINKNDINEIANYIINIKSKEEQHQSIHHDDDKKV